MEKGPPWGHPSVVAGKDPTGTPELGRGAIRRFRSPKPGWGSFFRESRGGEALSPLVHLRNALAMGGRLGHDLLHHTPNRTHSSVAQGAPSAFTAPLPSPKGGGDRTGKDDAQY